MKAIKLNKFEYDYLMAQKKVDVDIEHINEMIKRGNFESLKEYFVNFGTTKYISIDTIRLIENDIVVIDKHKDSSDKKDDKNINPSHYKQGEIECIEAIESATVNKKGIEAVCVANVIKYLWRYEEKNGLEDVKKAQWYLKHLVEFLEEGRG